MKTVTVAFFANIRELAHAKEATVAWQPTVLELMRTLSALHGRAFRSFCFDDPDMEKISRNVNILVNGKHIQHLNRDETPLAPGDTVAIFPLIGGG